MVKHIVMWTLKNENKDENAKKMKTDLEALKNKIDFLRFIQVGINFNSTDSAYDVVLVTEFDSRADLEAYQVHPEHKAVGVFVRSVVEKRAVVDYEF